MQSKIELNECIKNIVSTYNNFYENNPTKFSGRGRDTGFGNGGRNSVGRGRASNNFSLKDYIPQNKKPRGSNKIPILPYINNTLSKKYGIRVAWDNESNSYIINYDTNDTSNNIICNQANGVIFDKKTHKIKCFIYNAINDIDISEMVKYFDDGTTTRNFIDKLTKLENRHNYNLDKKNAQTDIKMVKIDSEELNEIEHNPQSFENNSSNKINDTLHFIKKNWEDYIIQELYDGTLIKLYFDGRMWKTATNKCVDASRSKWHSKRTFDELFSDIEIDYEILNKRHTYAFILLHPENRMISKYYHPALVHVGTFDLDKLCEVQESELDYCLKTNLDDNDSHLIDKTKKNDAFRGIMRNPKLCNYSNIEELMQSFEEINSSDSEYIFPGYFLVNKNNGDRIKIQNPKYKYVMNIKGNSRNITYRICQLSRSQEELDEFIKYFPEYKKEYDEALSILDKVAYYIHSQWHNKYVNHFKVFIPKELNKIVDNFGNYEPKSKTKTLEIAKKYVRSFNSEYILFIFNNILNCK